MKIHLKVLFLILIASTGLSINAQTYGFKTGFAMGKSKFSDSDEDDITLKVNPGFHGGLVFDLPLSNNLTLETGINFTTKGVRLIYSEYDYEIDYRYIFYNLEVPIKLKAYILSIQNSKVHISVGPYFGFTQDGKLKGTETYGEESYTGEIYLEIGKDEDDNMFKRFEPGLSLGIGLQRGPINIMANYDLGFSDISHFEEPDSYIKHRVLCLTVGYTFGILKKNVE